MELSFVQCNLNHCSAAQDLIAQYMVEEKVDIALLSDPYGVGTDPCAWLASAGSRRAAIYIASNNVTIANVIRDREFISAVSTECRYTAAPNQALEDFSDLLHRLEASFRSVEQGVPVLITGDFNARSSAWGDWISNSRGDELSLMLDSLDLVIANSGSTPTFARGAGSIIDLTLASESLARRVGNWRVLDFVFNFSDHHYIRFTLSPITQNPPPHHQPPHAGGTLPAELMQKLSAQVC
ncbi:uncharacterized protein LOC112603169 [Melanaphis sacchari]|uniref:uncharacterized protein LOC112603169 n=1 Tax=Melanaphis sacchari TaxID=742174 RepID=UPI000DC13501|nr:uncharacterized protein LOC112603169 [Melanaphis sacchari]